MFEAKILLLCEQKIRWVLVESTDLSNILKSRKTIQVFADVRKKEKKKNIQVFSTMHMPILSRTHIFNTFDLFLFRSKKIDKYIYFL